MKRIFGDSVSQFSSYLLGSLKEWRETKRSAFLRIPISQSNLISIAARYGFTFHHARNDYAMLQLWLDDNTESKIPQYANHQVGVAGITFLPVLASSI